MKIKIDFITNSSSTAYIVYIPNINKCKKEIFDWVDKALNQKLLKIINRFLKDLEDNDYLPYNDFFMSEEYFGDIDCGEKFEEVEAFKEFIYNNIISEYLVTTISLSGDGEDFILNINSIEIRRIKKLIEKNSRRKK